MSDFIYQQLIVKKFMTSGQYKEVTTIEDREYFRSIPFFIQLPSGVRSLSLLMIACAYVSIDLSSNQKICRCELHHYRLYFYTFWLSENISIYLSPKIFHNLGLQLHLFLKKYNRPSVKYHRMYMYPVRDIIVLSLILSR